MSVEEWDWDSSSWYGLEPSDEEIEADIAARTAADEASCSAHYWCARQHFNATQMLEPSIDIPF